MVNYFPKPMLSLMFYLLSIFSLSCLLYVCVCTPKHILLSLYNWSQSIHFLSRFFPVLNFQRYIFKVMKLLGQFFLILCYNIFLSVPQVFFFFWEQWVCSQNQLFSISHLFTASFSLSDLMLEDRILFTIVSSNSHGRNSSSTSLVCEDICKYPFKLEQ